MNQEKIARWLEAQLPGEAMRAFVRVGAGVYPGMNQQTPSGTPQARYIHQHGAVRGFDQDHQVGRHVNQVLVALTDRLFAIASLKGVWGAKPKELLHTCDRSALRCEWYDYTEGPNTYRNFVFFLPDDAWATLATQTTLLKKRNQMADLSDEFLQLLGNQAHEIDPEHPPPAEPDRATAP